MTNNKQQTINVIIRDNGCEEIKLTPVQIVQDYLKFIGFINIDKTVPQVIKGVINKALKMEIERQGYTKEDVLKAGEMGEINYHDTQHIIAYLDEAKAYNETYGGVEQ